MMKVLSLQCLLLNSSVICVAVSCLQKNILKTEDNGYTIVCKGAHYGIQDQVVQIC
jgi:hypothetical protein